LIYFDDVMVVSPPERGRTVLSAGTSRPGK
jgi:hypothetical protein